MSASTGETVSKQARVQKDRHEISGFAWEQPLQDVWESLKAYLLALGDDVQIKKLEHYIAFRRLKNFACVRFLQNELQVWAKLDPSSVELQEGFTRDVTHVGHLGTGNLEIRIQSTSDLEKAKPLLLRSYQQN